MRESEARKLGGMSDKFPTENLSATPPACEGGYRPPFKSPISRRFALENLDHGFAHGDDRKCFDFSGLFRSGFGP